MSIAAQGTRGQGSLPPDIVALFARDHHRPDSVDAVLLDRMTPVTFATQRRLYAPPNGPTYAGGRPELERYVHETLGEAFHQMQKALALTRFCHRIPQLFPSPDHPAVSGPGWALCGGTEEELIAEGNPLAAERARVLCALAQVAGIHARIVFLARPDPPERHAVAELFVGNRWGAFDGFSGRFYTWPKHGYASGWDIHQIPQLIDEKPDHGRQRYVDSAYFRHVAIALYRVDDSAAYTYPRDPVPPDLAARLRAGLGS